MLTMLFRLFGWEKPVLRPATITDAPRMAAIHAQGFAVGWGRGDLERMFVEDHIADALAIQTPWGEILAGFAISRVVLDEAELLTIAIDPAFRGRGNSAKLLRRHAERVRRAGARSIFLEVAVDNAPAIALYRRMGFSEIGHRKGYYAPDIPGTARRDARTMRLDVSGLDPTPRAY